MANRTKEYDKVYQTAWREKNREKTRAAATKHYNKKKDDPEFKAKHAERYKAWAIANPEKNKMRCKQYRIEKPDRHAIYGIRSLYKVSLIEAAQLFERKKHGCEACGSHTKPAIDHNHTTGTVRGVLCQGCNLAVGYSYENPATLRALANYLESHQ